MQVTSKHQQASASTATHSIAPRQCRSAQAGSLAAGACLAAARRTLCLLVEAQNLWRHVAASCGRSSSCCSAARQLRGGACCSPLLCLATRHRCREEAKVAAHICSWGGRSSAALPSREAAETCACGADAVPQGAVAAALAIRSTGAGSIVAFGRREGMVGGQRAEAVKQVGSQLALLLQHGRQAGAAAATPHCHSVGRHSGNAV